MEIQQASVLVSAVLVCLAPAPALTQTMTREDAAIIACQITPDEMFVEQCNRVSSSGSDDSNSRKKRGVNDVPSGFRPFNLNCPSATDQSAIYEINENFVDLDFDQFITDLFSNLTILTCLNMEVLLPKSPEAVDDAFLQESNVTCSSTVQRLAYYTRASSSQLCYVLNVGDVVLFEECSGDPFCQGCEQPSIHLNRQKRCITQYRAVNFWAYCPSSPDGYPFVREKLIIPVACKCLEVPCERVFLGP